MSVWHMQPDLAASRRQHKQLYQVQGRYLRYVGLVALACLVFLIAIHKAEYFINAQVIGHRTHMGVWELLAVMFVMEAVFGPAGLVAAPLFYAYLKKELVAARLV
jgi:predicted PurR-regulated permease PerM